MERRRRIPYFYPKLNYEFLKRFDDEEEGNEGDDEEPEDDKSEFPLF